MFFKLNWSVCMVIPSRLADPTSPISFINSSTAIPIRDQNRQNNYFALYKCHDGFGNELSQTVSSRMTS